MFKSVRELHGFAIHATDGNLGRVEECYFDDVTWTIRYIVVQTGSVLMDSRVLVSPKSVIQTEWANHRILTSLTQKQVLECPSIDTEKPVSRQYEIEFHQYYGWDYYWVSPGIWEYKLNNSNLGGDPHLRSSKEVIGYRIHATDGEIGHSEDFLIDEEQWRIRYMLVNTANWWFGHRVAISSSRIENVNWSEKLISINLNRSDVHSKPDFDQNGQI